MPFYTFILHHRYSGAKVKTPYLGLSVHTARQARNVTDCLSEEFQTHSKNASTATIINWKMISNRKYKSCFIFTSSVFEEGIKQKL